MYIVSNKLNIGDTIGIMMCMGAILYAEFSKMVYVVALQDNNDNYCPEMITNIDNLVGYGNSKP